MKTLINTYCLLLGVLLGTGIIYAGNLHGEVSTPISGKMLFQSDNFEYTGLSGRAPGTESQNSTFYSEIFGFTWNSYNYLYQEQSFVLSQKNYRTRTGFYSHLKI
jgi:hypothetical protein